jgi:hypothetical protein
LEVALVDTCVLILAFSSPSRSLGVGAAQHGSTQQRREVLFHGFLFYKMDILFALNGSKFSHFYQLLNKYIGEPSKK